MDRLDDTIKLFEEVLQKMRTKLSDTHQDTLIAMGNLAYFYNVVDRLDDAIKLGEERLAAEIGNRGEDHIIVAACHSMLGTIYFTAEDHAQAENHFSASLAIREREDASAWTTLRDQNRLGEVLVAQSKFDAAQPLLLDSHQKLMEQADQIPAFLRERMLRESAERLASYYDAIDDAESAAKYRSSVKSER